MSGGRGFSKRVGNILWLHFEGRTYTVAIENENPAGGRNAPGSGSHQQRGSARSKGAPSPTGLLKSPMPGKVLKINFKVGDNVNQGQTIAVIEAMKMEYALKAPFAGAIKEMLKKAGDAVALDEKIAQIQKASEAAQGEKK